MRSAMYIAWRKKPEHGSPRGPPQPAWATTARVPPAPPARVLFMPLCRAPGGRPLKMKNQFWEIGL